MSKIVQIAAAAPGWYLVQSSHDSVYPVAAWALTDSGEVIGMVGLLETGGGGKVPCLTGPPPLEARYVQYDELTPKQKESLQGR